MALGVLSEYLIVRSGKHENILTTQYISGLSIHLRYEKHGIDSSQGEDSEALCRKTSMTQCTFQHHQAARA